MKKIIAGLDFSDTSIELCRYALSFASEIGAELVFATILHDWDVLAVGRISSMGYNVDGDHYSDDIEHERIEKLKKIIENQGFPEVEKKLIVKTGKPAKELLKLIIEENADAIIIGAKCHKDLEHSLELSISDKIYKKSPVTVISYRASHHSKKLKRKIH